VGVARKLERSVSSGDPESTGIDTVRRVVEKQRGLERAASAQTPASREARG
jgi:hypothetical protein